jgi:NADH:ubiquinone oxidoreductase subunit
MNVGTWLYTLFNGTLVGVDRFGNSYYRGRGMKLNKRERRWVVYKGLPEASKIPAEWHAWLHHTVKEPLTEAAAQPHSWQKIHMPNLTGTLNAYRPDGHEYNGGKRKKATGDYEAWVPE